MRHGGRVDQLVLYVGSVVPSAAGEQVRAGARVTYWDLLLRQDDPAILASDANGHDVGSGDGLEGIFYGGHNTSAPRDSIKRPVCREWAPSSFVLVDCLGRRDGRRRVEIDHTDLIEPSLLRKDGDVPVDAGACSRVWCQSRWDEGGGRGIGCS